MAQRVRKGPWALFTLLITLVLAPVLAPYSLSQANAADVTTGLVAYWNFENGSTLGTPLYGSLNLTNAGSPAYTATGGNGSSRGLSLNGSSYLEASTYPSSLNGNNPYTIAAWFKTTQGNNGGILGYGSTGTCLGNNLRISSATTFLTYWYGCDYGSSAVSNFVNTWHHVAVTYDGTTHTFYYDGTFLNSGTGLTRATTGNRFYLGKTVDDIPFTGVLDDVAIYTRALSAADVADLKAGSLNFNANTTLSLSVSGNPKTTFVRQPLTLTAISSIDGRVTFKSNGKSIGGCVGKSTVSLVATCSWRPSVKGTSRLTAQVIPTLSQANASATSGTYWIQVRPRSLPRG
jgi:hypothetical protein